MVENPPNLSNHLNSGPAELGYTLPLQTVQTQISRFEETHWSGSALFVIKYVNLYQRPGSSSLIGWQLEVGGCPILIYSAW